MSHYGGSGGGGFRGGGGFQGGGGGGGFQGGGGGRPGFRGFNGGVRGGAEHLARIHGTEEDKVNCPFYYKIGACRHGDRCSRQHHKPPFSQTILMSHMFQNPASAVVAAGGNPELIDQEAANDEFEDFYEEVFEELSKFGTVEEMNVCDNLGDHLVGNVYVKFADEDDADSALKGLFGRWYAGRPMVPEFSPVTDFREARCRQYDDGTCQRGGQCNFMHVRYVAKGVRRYTDRIARRAERARKGSSRSRSRSRDRRRRSRSGSRERSSRGDRERRSERGERSERTSDRDRSDRDRSDRRRHDDSGRDRERDSDRKSSSRRERRGDSRERGGDRSSAAGSVTGGASGAGEQQEHSNGHTTAGAAAEPELPVQ